MATSDDPRALALARDQRGVEAELSPSDGLTVTVQDGALDPFVLALGRSDVAIRRLELPASPLESMFFALTDQPHGDPIVVPEPAQKSVSPDR